MELAEAIDAHFGWEPFGSGEEPDEYVEAALHCLRVASPDDLDRAIEKLPVFPLAAQRALRIILSSDWHLKELEEIAASDQALAANIIRAASSAVRPIETVGRAIMHLGSDRTSRVLYAASIQPMFASPALRDLWHHSVASAEVAQNLARISRCVDPKKAFLAGLVHDIGALAMNAFPGPFRTIYAQLTKLGCEPILAERVLSGFSHAEAGSRALAKWKFTSEFCEAIEFHHCPERTESKLASLLYLTEQWTDSCEDAPSAARFHYSLRALGISKQQFSEISAAPDMIYMNM